MGKYYQTIPSQQVDYTVDPRLYAAMSGALGKKSATKASTKDVLGAQVNVIPDDIPAYTEVKKEYEGEIADLTSQISRNPSGYKSVEPRIAQLRQKMSADSSPGGRLYAFNQRAQQWNGFLEQAKKAAGDDADLYGFNVEQISAGDQYIDDFGRPVPVKAGFTTAWNQKAEQDYLKSVKTTITPKLLRDAEVKNLEIGSKYKDAVSVMTDLGYTKEDVVDYIAGSITPEMLKSMQHTFNYGKARGQYQNQEFDDFLVGKVNTWADAIEGTKSASRQNIQFDTEAAVRAKAARAKTIAGPSPTIDDFAPVIGKMYETLTEPPEDLREAITSNSNKNISLDGLTDALNSASVGSNFGIQNAITEVAYNPKEKKFKYKSLFNLQTKALKPEEKRDEWVELSTSTIRDLNVNNAKYQQSAAVEFMKKLGIVNPQTQQFDFSKLLPKSTDPREGF